MPIAFYQSPIGWIKINADDEGIAGVDFTHPNDYEFFVSQQILPWQKSGMQTPILGECVLQLQEYFANKRKEFNLPLNLSGTKFQLKVWSTLQKVPYGSRISYQEIAQKSGHLTAHRAAANAVASNPISIIIPCHRVILSSGRIGGYAWGQDKKQWLLNFENI